MISGILFASIRVIRGQKTHHRFCVGCSQLQRKSNFAHSCQKRVPVVKSMPVLRVISPSAFRGTERNVVLSTRKEVPRPSSNFGSAKRPPTHSDNAWSIQFRCNS